MKSSGWSWAKKGTYTDNEVICCLPLWTKQLNVRCRNRPRLNTPVHGELNTMNRLNVVGTIITEDVKRQIMTTTATTYNKKVFILLVVSVVVMIRTKTTTNSNNNDDDEYSNNSFHSPRVFCGRDKDNEDNDNNDDTHGNSCFHSPRVFCGSDDNNEDNNKQ